MWVYFIYIQLHIFKYFVQIHLYTASERLPNCPGVEIHLLYKNNIDIYVAPLIENCLNFTCPQGSN